jgi:hypothetical protein
MINSNLKIILVFLCIYGFLIKYKIVNINISNFVFVSLALFVVSYNQMHNMEHLTNTQNTFNNLTLKGTLTVPNIVTNNISSTATEINMDKTLNLSSKTDISPSLNFINNKSNWGMMTDSGKRFIIQIKTAPLTKTGQVIFNNDATINIGNKLIQTDNILPYTTKKVNNIDTPVLKINGALETTSNIDIGGDTNISKNINTSNWSLYQDTINQFAIKNKDSSKDDYLKVVYTK